MSFYFLLANLTAFIGQFTGTLFIKGMNGNTVAILGTQMTAVQLLMLAQGILNLICAVLILHFLPQLTPDPSPEE